MLIDYLSFRLLMMKYELKTTGDDHADWDKAAVKEKLADGANNAPPVAKSIDRLGKIELSSPRMKRASKHVSKLKVCSLKCNFSTRLTRVLTLFF